MITYWLLQKDNEVIIFESSKETRASLKEQGEKIVGEFGSKKYAQIWCDYWNKKFDQSTLRRKLWQE